MYLLLGLLFLAGIGLLVHDYRNSFVEIQDGILRNDYGRGDKKELVTVREQDSGRQVGTVELKVSDRAYTREEIQQVFAEITAKMDTLILGSNRSLDHVDQDLQLLTAIPDQPIDVTWKLDRYDLMNIYGKLKPEHLSKEGSLVKLQAVLTYREDSSMQAEYECMANLFPFDLQGDASILEQIREAVRRIDDETKEKAYLKLPERLGETEVSYSYPFDRRGGVVMLAVVVIFILLYALDRQRENEFEKEKRAQMQLDYPEIVSKLTLLLGAGMNVKRAWRKIAEDYERHGNTRKKRYAYEEICCACHEMEGGVSEAESYERFGRRCGTQTYLRLGALLSQNLRKGTKGLQDLLRLEAIQAFEERKARARKAGEEAGTKLLIPMFLMLLEVLIVVIIPAFFSLQL